MSDIPVNWDPMTQGLRCKTCGYVESSWNKATSNIGGVASTLTVEHFRALKRMMDHHSHSQIASYEVVVEG